MVNMHVRFRIVFIAAAILIQSGCTDLTEFDHTLKAGINIMYPPDLSVVHTIENISGARSLCILPDCFIVATTDGTVFRFDLESWEQTGSFNIGNPSPSGYFEIEYSPSESTVYIIGALGQILEYNVPDMEFLHSFSICETPVDIEIASLKPYYYVAGANTCKIYEVSKENNLPSRYCTLASSPTCMAIDQCQDTMLVGTMGVTELVSTGPDLMRRRLADYFPGILAIETIPDENDETRLCAVLDYGYTVMIATVLNYWPGYSSNPLLAGFVPIEGNSHYICTDASGDYAYVLSYLGDNTSRLICYNCTYYNIESQVDIQGYPLDLEISSGGTLLVLTTE
ncbi:MAG: hypothetical protein KAW14_08670 [Candidatus Aegiribacteria sp.]|nr:hypothetical protein [Candidatus Aegiribacteria sp.]